jgi:hypothetical protein
MNSPIQHSGFRAWQDLYDATLQETDIPRLFALVENAEAAIRLRCETLEASPENKIEQEALEKALQTLFVIKRERLNFLQG